MQNINNNIHSQVINNIKVNDMSGINNAINQLKQIDFHMNGEITPIIFAEKVNGSWKQLFELFEENYAKVLFNKLQ